MRRKLFFTGLLLIICVTVFTQQNLDSAFKMNVGNLCEQIELNGIKFHDINRNMSSEFFLIEVLFDSSGGISKFNLLGSDSNYHRQHLQDDVFPKLKESWVKCKTSFTGLLIPVFIGHSLRSDATTASETLFNFFWRNYDKNKPTAGLYLTPPLPLMYSGDRLHPPPTRPAAH